MYYKRAFFIKARKYRRFGNVRIIICWHSKATPQRHVIQAVFSPDIKEKPIQKVSVSSKVVWVRRFELPAS